MSVAAFFILCVLPLLDLFFLSLLVLDLSSFGEDPLSTIHFSPSFSLSLYLSIFLSIQMAILGEERASPYLIKSKKVFN